MANCYITINRQFGSLGRPIAVKLAEMLGIEYYDRDIVEETAKQLGIPLAQASEQEGSHPHPVWAHGLPAWRRQRRNPAADL